MSQEKKQSPQTATTSKEQAFIALNMRAIEAQKKADLQFIIVNETIQLAPYRQAAFFSLRNRKPTLTTASGLVSVAENSPYSVWLNKLAQTFNLKADYQLLSIDSVDEKFQVEWQCQSDRPTCGDFQQTGRACPCESFCQHRPV